MNTSRKLWLAASLTAALTLGGCFGGGNDDEVVAPGNGNDVPDSAGASVAAFITYLLALSPNDETFEPSAIKDTFAVPPDEDGEPQPLV